MNKYVLAAIGGLGISILCCRASASAIVAYNNNGQVSYAFDEGGSGGSGQPFAYFRGYDCSIFLQQPVTPIYTPPPPTHNNPGGNTDGNNGGDNGGGDNNGGGNNGSPPDNGGNPIVTTPTITTTAVPLPNSAALAGSGLAGIMIIRRLRSRPISAA